jgi:hypothetical protein
MDVKEGMDWIRLACCCEHCTELYPFMKLISCLNERTLASQGLMHAVTAL